MARANEFTVVVATDGSRPAIAAVGTALAFPWPRHTEVIGVVARRTPATSGRPGYVLAAYDRHWAHVAASATRALRRRWPDAEAHVADATPADAILAEAKRRRADAIVLGWRGHGLFHRLLVGSVSHAVLRHATCSVLVTRRRPREIRRFVVGVDGSPAARRATELVGQLAAPRGAQVTVVHIVEPLTLPSLRLLPASVRGALSREASALERKETAQARREVDAAVKRLQAAGWKARALVREGAPLRDLLATVDESDADALVLGARGAGGVERLLLGSIAEGAVHQARVPVLIAR